MLSQPPPAQHRHPQPLRQMTEKRKNEVHNSSLYLFNKSFWMRWLVGFMTYPVLASVRADLDVSSVIQYLISFPSIHISRYWDIASLTLCLPSHAVINCLSGMRSIMIITIFPNCCTGTDLIISSHEKYFINSHDLHCTPYHWIRH